MCSFTNLLFCFLHIASMYEPFLVVDRPVESTTIVRGVSSVLLLLLSLLSSSDSNFLLLLFTISSTLLLICVKCISSTILRYSERASVIPLYHPVRYVQTNPEEGKEFYLCMSQGIHTASPSSLCSYPSALRSIPWQNPGRTEPFPSRPKTRYSHAMTFLLAWLEYVMSKE